MFIRQHDILERERNGNERGVVLLDVHVYRDITKAGGGMLSASDIIFSSFSYVTLKIRFICHVEAFHAPCVILYPVF